MQPVKSSHETPSTPSPLFDALLPLLRSHVPGGAQPASMANKRAEKRVLGLGDVLFVAFDGECSRCKAGPVDLVELISDHSYGREGRG